MTPTDEDMKVAREIVMQLDCTAPGCVYPDPGCECMQTIARALASQREACAQAAEQEYASDKWHSYYRQAGWNIAAAIRADKKG